MPLAARTCHTTCRTSGNLLKSACRPRQSLPPPASAAAAEGKRSVVPATAQQQHSSYHSSSHAAGSDSLVANKSGGGSYPRLHGVSRRAAADAGDGAPLLPLQQTLLLAAGPQGVRKFHTTTQRPSAHGPMSPSDLSTRKKVTINTLRKMYEKKEKISMVTAHDFPSGLLADQAGIDVVLVGDSLAMVGLGMEDTNQITLDDMLHHSRAVARGVRSAFLVTDLPMGSYELSPQQALQSSIAIVQKGRATSVKIEGGKEIAETIRAITRMGIPVLGHIGLTPQRQGSLGGFVVQSKTAASASKLLSDALAVQDAGAWGMVLEAVPADMARLVTEALDIPTIGIGAGEGCSGQVLVQIDMLGNFPSGRFLPKFVKQYANVFEVSRKAIEEYKDEVKAGSYPAKEHTYPVKEQEVAEFKQILEQRKSEIEASKERRRSFD